MRVINHKKSAKTKPETDKKRRGISVFVSGFIVVALLAAVGVYGYGQLSGGNTPDQQNTATLEQPNLPEEDPFEVRELPLKQLQGDQFKELFRSVALPNTQEIVTPPSITGDDKADERIREWADIRGYKLSRIPMGAIVKVENEPRLGNDDLLQPLAAHAWYKLKAAAAKDNIAISLSSAYRAPDYQRELFTDRLLATGVTLTQVANGAADDAIEQVLQLVAIPGYSRHHTGYTIDLWCEDGSLAFVDSICFDWMSDENYKNAMTFGWIPSYPEGATEQGPEPEPWEYVWVGDAAVRKQQ